MINFSNDDRFTTKRSSASNPLIVPSSAISMAEGRASRAIESMQLEILEMLVMATFLCFLTCNTLASR